MNVKVDPAGARCVNRVVEWMVAAMMLNFAATTFFFPGTIAVGSFRYLPAIGVSAEIFVVWTGLTGGAHVLALYYNGRGLPWTARGRALCSIFEACTFAAMAWCLAFLTKDTHEPSLGVGTHLALAGVALYSCLRAGADVNEKYRIEALRAASEIRTAAEELRRAGTPPRDRDDVRG